MRKLVYDREIYLPKRTEVALRLAASRLADDNTTADGLAVRYLDECLNRDYPGVFGVVDACQEAYETTRKENKKRFDTWKESNV